ncbi:hypothetical protein [Nucisporomicrobium flavum]|uniref:hypothetical protein n=1 Tax=Nucisporomicrobium flavum TaxID=2785915 RepID=UPI0018F388FD|nr:hypothetical protein [Nucisporomicrobium flavum]
MPAGILFARAWDDVSDRKESTRLEQKGVEYLTALGPLVSALTEAQSSALSGVATPPSSLTSAVAGVSAVDQRLGAELRTRDRWSGLKQRIDLLPKATGGPLAVYQAHVEVADLTLALYDAVRNNSELARDPDNDISHLQQAVADDLPAAVVQMSRMSDLSQLVAKADAQQRAQLGPQFGAAVVEVNTSVNNLTDNLQAAVDDTSSPTLSGNLVSGLDAFRRGVELLTRGANPTGAPNASTIATAQTRLQVSLGNLAGITTREMTRLLDDRLDSLGYRTLETLAAAIAAVLLALAAIILPLTGRRRGASGPSPSARAPGESTRDMTVGPGGVELGGQMPAYGDATSTRRERTGALR